MKTRLFPMVWAAWLILPARTEVEAIARELVTGIVAGDWAPWERHAADELLYTTELGRTLTKQELKTVFRPVDSAQRPAVTMAVVDFRSRGDAAVLVLDIVSRAPDGIERYRLTQTYWRTGGRWRLFASHACEPPGEAR